MDFEVLKKDNRKYWILGIIVIILLASVIFFVGTKAKYRLTQKVNIASGTINWHPPVFSIVSIKTSSDGTNYNNASSVPTSGYTLSNKSYCEVRGVKDSNITISYSNGNVTVNTSNINTKCYLYFDRKPLARDTILAGKTISTARSGSIGGRLTSNTTGTIYSAKDNDGTSYFYAGAVGDNWVKFGGFYWRIIRINGDDTIRMIYVGTKQVTTGSTTYIDTDTKDYYSTSDGAYDDNKYVGYMYTNGNAHGNGTSSYAKQLLDKWYNENLNKTGIKEYIDTNAGFCADRGNNISSEEAPNDSGGIGSTRTYYAAYYRLMNSTRNPSLKCTNSNDLYTVSSSNKGNKALTYPVGLITADEVMLAGGFTDTFSYVINRSYYLYTGQWYWTMSPSHFDGRYASLFCVGSDGELGYNSVNNNNALRPVINLKADVVLSGDGSSSNPYQIA